MANNQELSIKRLKTKRSTQEYTLISLCIAGILGISPFAGWRFMQGQMLLAAIDSAIVIGVIGIGLHVLLTRQVRITGILLTVFYMCGMVAAVYASDAALIYWAFPTTTAAYFLVKPREAAFISLVALIALQPIMIGSITSVEQVGILVALTINNIFSYAVARNMQLNARELAQQATRDSLTGAGNRRLFDEKVLELIAMQDRDKTPTSLVILDIDNFKTINDRFGHIRGDEVLINLAGILRERLRKGDGLYRLGGEEFAIVANRADRAMALSLAEELRGLVETSDLVPAMQVTISLGVAECDAADDAGTWFEKADSALYQAKNRGRNQTCIAA